jgi:hypothetical protein
MWAHGGTIVNVEEYLVISRLNESGTTLAGIVPEVVQRMKVYIRSSWCPAFSWLYMAR